MKLSNTEAELKKAALLINKHVAISGTVRLSKTA